MKFALVDGHRREAAPGLSGTCPIDGRPMIAKCGKKKFGIGRTKEAVPAILGGNPKLSGTAPGKDIFQKNGRR
jgi:hypothetical protein